MEWLRACSATSSLRQMLRCMKFENILVPIDFSDDASTALDQAIELAATSGGRLHQRQ